MAKFIRSKHLISTYGVDVPTISDTQMVCKIVSPRGDSTFEAVDEHDNTVLIMLPSKFSHQIFIKRDDYVIVDPATEQNTKLFGMIDNIVATKHLKKISKDEKWPQKWAVLEEEEVLEHDFNENPNRRYLDEDKFELDDNMGELGEEIESEDF